MNLLSLPEIEPRLFRLPAHNLASIPTTLSQLPTQFVSLSHIFVTLYRRLGGLQDRSGQVWKISLPKGFDPQIVQPVGSRYTDYTRKESMLIKYAKSQKPL
jgi:hypothetical protein